MENMAENLFSDPTITQCDPQVFSGAVETLKSRGTKLEELFDKAVAILVLIGFFVMKRPVF